MSWLKRLWDRWSVHPTGSAALGALIAAAIIAAVTFLVQGLRAVALSPATGQITQQVGHWLWAPVAVHRLFVLVTSTTNVILLAYAAVIWWARRKMERQRRELIAAAALPISEANAPAVRRTSTAAKLDLLKAVKRMADGKPLEPAPSREKLTLDVLDRWDRELLTRLSSPYPAPMSLTNLAQRLGRPVGIIEQKAEALRDAELVSLIMNPHHGNMVSLTKTGRDFCIANGLIR